MPSTAVNKTIHVAVGVLRRANGDILIARRADSAHQGGLWEFPGGKREPHEDILQALVREFHEELGLAVQRDACRPLLNIHHDYPDKSVQLDVWWIDHRAGEPQGKEGQPLRWVAPQALVDYPFPEANRAILEVIARENFQSGAGG